MSDSVIKVNGRDFVCPPDVERGSLEVLEGVYDPGKVDLGKEPLVLDIGANVGAFSVWAASRYPDATVHAYEPHPGNFEYLKKNTEHLPVSWNPKAVVGCYAEPKKFLRDGQHNCGEKSLYDVGEQLEAGVEVETMFAGSLPECAFLKIDTEGCEPEIIEKYVIDGAAYPMVIAFEWHRNDDKWKLAGWLVDNGYKVVREVNYRHERGVLVFVAKYKD